jgi:hypothetical protein
MEAMTPSSSTVMSLAPGAVKADDTAATHNCALWDTVKQ